MFTARDLRDTYLELSPLGRWVDVAEIVETVESWAPPMLVERAVDEAAEIYPQVLVHNGSIMFRV